MCVAVELQDVAAQSERGREGHDSARVDRPWHYHYHYHRSGFHRLELDAVNLSSAFSIAAVEFDARRPKLLTIAPVYLTIARSHARTLAHTTMSRASKITLATTTALTAGLVYFVHWAQETDQEVSLRSLAWKSRPSYPSYPPSPATPESQSAR